MKLIEIVLTSISLATDAFAASVGRGISSPKRDMAYSVVTAVTFGSFQAIMPVIGWCVGATLADVAGRIAPIVSFVLLCFIGVGMIYDSIADNGEKQKKKRPTLLGAALATSIDALSAGVGLGLYRAPIVLCSLIIGGVTFVLSLVGVLLGNLLGSKCGRTATFWGGVLLCGIGIKILAESLIRFY